MRYIKKSETEPRDLREYKKNCRKASPPLKITYKDKQTRLFHAKIKWPGGDNGKYARCPAGLL